MVKIYEVSNYEEHSKIIIRQGLRSAEWFKQDAGFWKNKKMSEIFNIVKKKYKTESVETIRSPQVFWAVGGDCDCQASFWIGYFSHLYPQKTYKMIWDNFYLVYCGRNRIQHVFLEYKNPYNNHRISLDSLPGMSFNTRRKYGVEEIYKCE